MLSRLKQTEMFPMQLPVDGRQRYASLVRDALLRATESRSRNTQIAYEANWERWAEWCEVYDADPSPPIDPALFQAHLEWLVQQGYRRSTILLRMRVLSLVDQHARATPAVMKPTPIMQHHVVRAWWKSYIRDAPEYKTQAPFVSREDLAKILRGMFARRTTDTRVMHRARDRALILLGYLGAFRRVELHKLTLDKIERVPRGIFIRWDHSKADQEGVGEERLILPQEELELCAVEAWDTWYALYRAEPLFQGEPPPSTSPAFPVLKGPRVQSHPLNPYGIYSMIVRHGEHVGVKITPHSLRAAFATHSIERHEASEVAFHGRWRGGRSMDRYIRRGRTWSKNPTKGLSRLET